VTAAVLSSFPGVDGVRVSDGIGNTVPWPAASEEPFRFRAISKHPYHTGSTYPGPVPGQSGKPVDALGHPDFLPSNGYNYTAVMPEYTGSYIQTESIIRDAGPVNNSVNGVIHGSGARIGPGGSVLPCPVWITEINSAPNHVFGPNVTESQAFAWKQKMMLRYFAFYPHKGVEKLCMFDATTGDASFGMVADDFVRWAVANPQAKYPQNDTLLTSPALRSLRAMLDAVAWLPAAQK